MTASRFYSSTAGQMFLSGPITSPATSAILTSVTGLPASLPYTLLLDPGLTTEEVVTVTAIGSMTVTITRGVGWDLPSGTQFWCRGPAWVQRTGLPRLAQP